MSATLYADFKSFSSEVGKLKKAYKWQDGKLSKGGKYFGDMYGIIDGDAQTSKLFVNAKLGSQDVENLKIMWNEYTKGNLKHADKNEAKRMVSTIAKLYAPEKESELLAAFFGTAATRVVTSEAFKFSFKLTYAPLMTEHLMIVTEL
jgi:hypothetical protein